MTPLALNLLEWSLVSAVVALLFYMGQTSKIHFKNMTYNPLYLVFLNKESDKYEFWVRKDRVINTPIYVLHSSHKSELKAHMTLNAYDYGDEV